MSGYCTTNVNINNLKKNSRLMWEFMKVNSLNFFPEGKVINSQSTKTRTNQPCTAQLPRTVLLGPGQNEPESKRSLVKTHLGWSKRPWYAGQNAPGVRHTKGPGQNEPESKRSLVKTHLGWSKRPWYAGQNAPGVRHKKRHGYNASIMICLRDYIFLI